MNDSAQRRKRNQRLFDGRIEKRLPVSVPVYLASMEEPRARERTRAENVSLHSVRLISKRSWRTGEESLIAPLTGDFPRIGTVIYCVPKSDEYFYVGVEFPDRTVKWDDHSRA